MNAPTTKHKGATTKGGLNCGGKVSRGAVHFAEMAVYTRIWKFHCEFQRHDASVLVAIETINSSLRSGCYGILPPFSQTQQSREVPSHSCIVVRNGFCVAMETVVKLWGADSIQFCEFAELVCFQQVCVLLVNHTLKFTLRQLWKLYLCKSKLNICFKSTVTYLKVTDLSLKQIHKWAAIVLFSAISHFSKLYACWP